MKIHKHLTYVFRVFMLLLFICTMYTIQSCSTPTDILDSYVQSPNFKDIRFDLIPEDTAQESNIGAFIASGKAILGNDDPYHLPLLFWDSLSSQIGGSDGAERLYMLLFQQKYLSLKSYFLRMKRKNVQEKYF